jgi:hypothetical protein
MIEVGTGKIAASKSSSQLSATNRQEGGPRLPGEFRFMVGCELKPVTAKRAERKPSQRSLSRSCPQVSSQKALANPSTSSGQALGHQSRPGEPRFMVESELKTRYRKARQEKAIAKIAKPIFRAKPGWPHRNGLGIRSNAGPSAQLSAVSCQEGGPRLPGEFRFMVGCELKPITAKRAKRKPSQRSLSRFSVRSRNSLSECGVE